MSSASRRARNARLPGPVLVLASVVVVAAAVAGAWYALGRRPSATGIVDVLALDGEYAVMVRDVARDPGRSFLSLMSAERGEVWGAMIPRYEMRHETRTHLAATAGVITVRGSTGGIPYVFVFAAARGAKLGRYALAGEQPASRLPGSLPDAFTLSASSMAGGGQSFELVSNERPDDRADARTGVRERIEVVAIDLEQGAPLWRRVLGRRPVGPVWLRERHLLVQAGERLHVLDRRTGEPAHGEADGYPLPWPCVIADRVYGVPHDAGGLPRGGVHVLSLASGELHTTGIEATLLSGLCGTHGDRDILAVTRDDTGALVSVDPRTQTVHWRIDLGQPLLESPAAYLGVPDVLAGPLPRFVPVLVGQATQPALVWLDVEAGRIAASGTPTPLLYGAHVMLAGERFYLWTPEGPTLAALDGATGALAAAVELPGMGPVWPRHVAAGRVWVTRPAHDGDRGDAWFVLDGKTLDVLAAGLGNELMTSGGASTGAAITGVRARFAGSLGLP
jgi:hypothetical protein